MSIPIKFHVGTADPSATALYSDAVHFKTDSKDIYVNVNNTLHRFDVGNRVSKDGDIINGQLEVNGKIIVDGIKPSLYYTTNIGAGGDGWYRIYTGTNGNASGDSAVTFFMGRSYNSPQNEEYSFSVVCGYNGDISITQLSGAPGGHLIKKIRVLWKNSAPYYIDFYTITGAYINNYYVYGGKGIGEFHKPTLVSEVEEDYTSYEFETVYGFKCSNGLTGNLTGNATSAGSIVDSGDGRTLTINYSADAITEPIYLAAWNGNELRGVRRDNLTVNAATLAYYPATGGEFITTDNISYQSVNSANEAGSATYATYDASGRSFSDYYSSIQYVNDTVDNYVLKSGSTMSGNLHVEGAQIIADIYGDGEAGKNNAPAIIMDKPGLFMTGIGACNEDDTILFAPVYDGLWKLENDNVPFKQKWKFHGDVIADNFTGRASIASKLSDDGWVDWTDTLDPAYLPEPGYYMIEIQLDYASGHKTTCFVRYDSNGDGHISTPYEAGQGALRTLKVDTTGYVYGYELYPSSEGYEGTAFEYSAGARYKRLF